MQVFLETDRLVLRRFTVEDADNLVNLDEFLGWFHFRPRADAAPGERVTAEAMAVNQASRRVMEKAGLTLVRTFHQPWPYSIDGSQFGDVEYALDKAQWRSES